MMIVAIAAETQVAIIADPKSIPVCEIIAGLTKMMYAIAMNVVIPATVSVLMFVPSSPNLK
jgi:hypothetical protein